MEVKKKKILIMVPFFTLGGAETQAYLLAQHLKTAGYYVEVWAFPGNSSKTPLADKLNSVGIATRLLPFEMNILKSRLAKYKALLQYISMVRKVKFDAIIPFTYWPNLLCNVTSIFSGAKKVFWNQRNVEDHAAKPQLEKLVKLRQPVWISNSKPAKQFLMRRFSLSADAVKIISNGFVAPAPVADKEDWRKKTGTDTQSLVITMVANFYPEKDHLTILHAISKLRDRFPNIRLLLPGYPASKVILNEIKALAFDLNLNSHVYFPGSIDDVSGLLGITHIGLLSTKSEGCPNSLLEYMGAGLPVVVTNIQAITDILGTDYPFLFNVGDVDGLADKLTQLIVNEPLRTITGKELQQLVSTRFVPAKMYEAYSALIES